MITDKKLVITSKGKMIHTNLSLRDALQHLVKYAHKMELEEAIIKLKEENAKNNI